MSLEKLFTLEEVAEELGVVKRTVQKYVFERGLGSVVVAGKRRIPQVDLELWVYGMDKADYYERRIKEYREMHKQGIHDRRRRKEPVRLRDPKKEMRDEDYEVTHNFEKEEKEDGEGE